MQTKSAMEWSLLIGNVFFRMSILQTESTQRVLLSFSQDREEEFVKAAPQLFGAQFPKDAADHLKQVAALCRTKSQSALSEGFSISVVRPAILCIKVMTKAVHQAQDSLQQASSSKDSQITINNVGNVRIIKCSDSYVAEWVSKGHQRQWSVCEGGKQVCLTS